MTILRWLPAAAIAIMFQPMAAERQAATEATSRTFDANGVKIHYLIQGKGELVVLIRGLYASAEINWNKTSVIGDLAKDHLVIALDLPGHGQSDGPENDDGYGMQDVEDVVLLLEHLKNSR
jgi:pimeloyl-ACP methyl ester carboxylesterase